LARHTWRNSDSLSSLASDAGLASWERIWNDPGNAALREERGSPENIREGDIIEIPAPVLGEVSRPTEARHAFVRVGVPPASIKIIDDGGNPSVAVANERRVVQVSTFVTSLQLPTGFLTASTDRRNFKIEVFDEGASGQFITCELEAMKPKLDARSRPERDADGKITYESFSPKRIITGLRLRRVPGLSHIYRSRYLRLVTDAEDDAARPDQTLLTDHDPNNLDIEILDQEIVARYTAVSGEPLATEAVVGDGEKRVRCQVFVCRPTFGAANLVGGIQAADAKRHILSWVRRTYAAANMAPRLVTEVEIVDPVENMLWIRATNRNGAQGNRVISFRVNTTPAPTVVQITTVARETPAAITNRLAAEARRLLPADYVVSEINNPPGIYNNLDSSDILITHPTERVIIDQNRTRDNRIRVIVSRVRPNQNSTTEVDFMNIGSAANRAMTRNYRTDPSALAIFVIGRFGASEGAVGFAFPRWFRERAPRHAVFPVFGSCFVEARTVATNDRMVHTTDHEMGHILVSMVHFSGRNSELMSDAPVNNRNSVWDSKRLSDRVLPYQEFVRGTTRNFPLNPNSEIRTREPGFIEGWNDFLTAP
jgi:hypothetical protein